MTDNEDKSQKKNAAQEQDSKLWKHITRDVTPLDKNVPAPVIGMNSSASKKIKSINKPEIKPNIERKQAQSGDSEIDRRTAQRLSRGQIPIEGRIDLHGLTQNAAYDALLRYIPDAYRQGKRCILVITGKGNKQEGGASLLDQKIGILRKKTPEWLSHAPLNQYVLKIQRARPNHGGEGAIYVLLRREKNRND